MTGGAEHKLIDAIFRGLRGTFLEGRLILGGSSALFAFPTHTLPYTEDLDFYISEELVVDRGADIVRLLEAQGYRRQPETPTFDAPGYPSFDLVGYSSTVRSDHLSPPGPLQVMVFGDLGVILEFPGTVTSDATGRAALSAAGFAAVKLMTVRVEKGAKDKLQAILVVSERSGDALFRGTLSRVLARFGDETCRDVLADAQMAFLALKRDPTFQDHGAERYALFLEGLEAGYAALIEIVKESLDG
ncbi:MAG: hypothetical protein FJ276_00970 [Planctomycetes bacterium]|nr:hypothetical protein [Planctomycetota bacterium]